MFLLESSLNLVGCYLMGLGVAEVVCGCCGCCGCWGFGGECLRMVCGSECYSTLIFLHLSLYLLKIYISIKINPLIHTNRLTRFLMLKHTTTTTLNRYFWITNIFGTKYRWSVNSIHYFDSCFMFYWTD